MWPRPAKARYDHNGGPREITQVCPYPQLGPCLVRGHKDGELVATLSGTETHVTTLELNEGPLIFTAETIFEAEQTGESFDIGGWFQVRAL